MYYIYLDHNIIDDVSKHNFPLKASDELVWVYSNENLNEIKRAGDTRFLDVLRNLRARKIELVLDSNFHITDNAELLTYVDPYQLYERYVDVLSKFGVDEIPNLEFLARLHGANNHDRIRTLPDDLKRQIEHLLEPHGLYTEDIRKEVNKVASDLDTLISGPLQDIQELESSRAGIGTNKGRVGRLSEEENPIEHIWNLLKENLPGISADQFFGFDPHDKQGYERWPLYLGIVGCHSVLNYIGYRPDKGLAKVDELPGILSDGSHIGYARYCHAVLSQDKRFCAKAKAIYRFKNIPTVTLLLEQRKSLVSTSLRHDHDRS